MSNFQTINIVIPVNPAKGKLRISSFSDTLIAIDTGELNGVVRRAEFDFAIRVTTNTRSRKIVVACFVPFRDASTEDVTGDGLEIKSRDVRPHTEWGETNDEVIVIGLLGEISYELVREALNNTAGAEEGLTQHIPPKSRHAP